MARLLHWRRLPLALLLIVLLLAAGCARTSRHADGPNQADDGVVLALAVSPDPPAVGAAELTITLVNDQGQAIDGAALAIKADMSHPGMTPQLASVAASDEGVYRTAIDWTMAGDWIVTVVATLPDGRVIRRQFDLSVAGAAPVD